MYELPTDKIISCFYGSSEDCIKVVDPSGTLMSMNPNGLDVMEIDDEAAVIGSDWLSFWDGELRQKAEDALSIAKRGTLAKFEGWCPTFKGTMKYWHVSIAPLYGDFREIQWLLVMSHDVTEMKELEKKVTEQELRIKELESQLVSA